MHHMGSITCATPENEPEKPIRTGGHWCAIAVTTEEEWGALCESMGMPELRTDPRFESIEEDGWKIRGSWTG